MNPVHKKLSISLNQKLTLQQVAKQEEVSTGTEAATNETTKEEVSARTRVKKEEK